MVLVLAGCGGQKKQTPAAEEPAAETPALQQAQGPQHVEYGGLQHTAVGPASLAVVEGRLQVDRTAEGATFGVSVALGSIDSVDFYFEPMTIPSGGTFMARFTGQTPAGPQPVASFRHTGQAQNARLDMIPGAFALTTDSITVSCLRNGQLVRSLRRAIDPQAANALAQYEGPGRSCHWICDCDGGGCSKLIDWDPQMPGQLRFPGDPQTYTCDYLKVEFDLAGGMQCPGAAEFLASGVPAFVETGVQY